MSNNYLTTKQDNVKFTSEPEVNRSLSFTGCFVITKKIFHHLFIQAHFKWSLISEEFTTALVFILLFRTFLTVL